jgi:hypothetical protein
VVYGDEYAENRGVWDRFGFTGRIIGLLRGCCLPWAHPHSASKLIRRSTELLPARILEVLVYKPRDLACSIADIANAAAMSPLNSDQPSNPQI